VSEALAGKHVVVVGGSSGIGRATAALAVRAGASVSIAARDPARLERVAGELGARSGSVDMTDPGSVGPWADALGDLDHLIITASSSLHGRFDEISTDAVRRMFEAKFFGPYNVAKALLPRMREGGSITFFSGVLSRRPGLNCSGLGAVNAAVEGLTRALALELGPKLRVNCISPGMVKTEAYSSMSEEGRDQMFEATGASLPLGRVGLAGEIAEAALFVAVNSFLTGQVLDVDGGHMVRQYATR
jgi:NAD(P)-dependent dehydrogenase (short-subunit alcohol dehydrogenase family)